MMYTASEDDGNDLLDRWRRGDRDDSAWFRLLRRPMTVAAGRGIRRMTGRPANDGDVGEAVYKAFQEFIDCDPDNVTTPVGLAVQIAYRRGQDVGRALNQIREFPDSELGVRLERDPRISLTSDRPRHPEDELLKAEQAMERERLAELALGCVEQLLAGQRDVVRATILGDMSLSDWANEGGKSYQAADQQRKRALAALMKCVKGNAWRGGGDHVV